MPFTVSPSLSPRSLLLLDAAGALVSALLLGIVLPFYQPVFGIPVSVLHWLALPPLLFVAFDLYAIRFGQAGPRRFLRIIAAANLAYCGLSLALAFAHYGELTGLGWGYLITEIVIVVVLAGVEFSVAANG